MRRGDLASRFAARVTPTLLFLDPFGAEIAPRIVGVNTIEMFGYYVDKAIETARKRLTAA